MTPRKKVEQELTREMILDAARVLFVEKGFQSVSMRQVAKTLDYSHGAIYYHFKNKADLFYALVDQDFHLLDQTVNRIMEQPLSDSEKLQKVLIGFIEFGLTHQNHYEIMFLIKDEEFQHHIQVGPNQSYANFAQTVHQLSEVTLTVQDVWSLFLSLHGFVAHYWRCNQSFDEVRLLAEAHVSFLIKLLRK
ncbi:TetR/AcrR family transcriptional regulator [Pseudalkalibacillus berkeleyi]|uniref:TetR/AcrR family transcriptional regulator n=1 Tax=Pseudalkalibacillus berkeleyi TaxID=1069813 RepID=A0ABS9H550_9BACL|nr:TetR/AcrR family transcriptional regulator [Pseudalkalibacillus berkeleyi]MCF6139023.1 TetR/AcrR family transcriptional regulator [Pseudalkalibacillus berkeleyi]